MRKIIFVLIIFLICLFPITINAASISVDVECPSSTKEEFVNCVIKVNPNGANLRGIQANIEIENGTYDSFIPNDEWTIYSNSNLGFSLGKVDAVTEVVVVGTLKVQLSNKVNTTIKLSNIAGSDSKYNTLEAKDLSVSVKNQIAYKYLVIKIILITLVIIVLIFIVLLIFKNKRKMRNI